jgi:hypothetical protein
LTVTGTEKALLLFAALLTATLLNKLLDEFLLEALVDEVLIIATE